VVNPPVFDIIWELCDGFLLRQQLKNRLANKMYNIRKASALFLYTIVFSGRKILTFLEKISNPDPEMDTQ
jgi:hypothetical protein